MHLIKRLRHRYVPAVRRCVDYAQIVVVVVFIHACGCSKTASLLGPAQPGLPEPAAIVLEPGDEIDIKFRYWPELNELQTIRPDGRISLQLVDEVIAEARTPADLDTYLTHLYQDKLKDPEITVIVRSLANQRIYVGGEVNTPGVLPLQHHTTVMEAIMTAGGFDNLSAEPATVIVVRHIDGKRYATTVDLTRTLNDPESDPIYLVAKDIVYVPQSRVDRANQWVDQYLNKMIPSTVLNFAHTRGRTTVGISPR